MGGLQRFDLIILYNNICMWFYTIIYVCGLDRISVLKFCVDPQIWPKFWVCLKITKQTPFFILLYFVFFFLYYYKQTVLHLASPSFLSTFKDNNCNFLVLRLFTGCFLTLSWPDYCPFSLATELYCFNMLSPIESYSNHEMTLCANLVSGLQEYK